MKTIMIFLILFCLGCNGKILPEKIDLIPEFEFLDTETFDCNEIFDPNNCESHIAKIRRDNRFKKDILERSRIYNQIIDASPVPVYIMSRGDYYNLFYKKYTLGFGQIDSSAYYNGWNFHVWEVPFKSIYVNNLGGPDYIIGNYFHELGHYYCQVNGCFCSWPIIGGGVLSEVHAMEYAYLCMRDYGFLQCIYDWRTYVDSKFGSDDLKYVKAAAKIIQMEIYAEAKELTENDDDFYTDYDFE